MIELLVFGAAAYGFYYFIQRSSKENKPSAAVTVGEAKARNAEDEFNIYEGVNKEDLISSLLEKAKRLLKARAFKNAEKIFLEVIKNDPKNIDAFRGLGELYLELNNYDEAALSFEKITVINDKDEEAWNNLGLIYYETENFKQAEFAYEKAIFLNKGEVDKYMNLAIIKTKLEDLEGAAEVLEKAVKIKTAEESYKFLFGLYKKLGDIDKADKVNKALKQLKK